MLITITSVAGAADGAGHRYTHGATAEVDERLGRAWIEAGHAVAAEPTGAGPAAAGTESDEVAEPENDSAGDEQPASPKPKRTKRTADKPPADTRDE